ncbi:hypothetical protein ABT56_05335 [Photobacterium aquae]|uniref:Uncharacterized protein n=1 Tax=Photobacterium aquae TaxID=1195763 RepID=A0A0J1H6Y3_9GAMM|nr:hypothetical protein ABT56_05335 [Photobacterium aquae]
MPRWKPLNRLLLSPAIVPGCFSYGLLLRCLAALSCLARIRWAASSNEVAIAATSVVMAPTVAGVSRKPIPHSNHANGAVIANCFMQRRQRPSFARKTDWQERQDMVISRQWRGKRTVL